MCIAATALLALRAFDRKSERTSRGQRTILWCAGVALALHFATWIASLDYTTVAISTLLVSASPLWTALYDGLVRRRRFPLTVPLAFVAATLGLILITSSHHSAPPYPGHATLGALLALLGSVAFAAYLLLVREVRSVLRTRTIVLNTYTCAAIVLVLAAAVAHQGPPALHSTTAWGGILAMALVSQLLGHTGMNAALRWFSPSAVSFSTLLEPVIAAFLALLLFGEQLSGLAIAGAILLLGAIGLAIWTAPD